MLGGETVAPDGTVRVDVAVDESVGTVVELFGEVTGLKVVNRSSRIVALNCDWSTSAPLAVCSLKVVARIVHVPATSASVSGGGSVCPVGATVNSSLRLAGKGGVAPVVARIP